MREFVVWKSEFETGIVSIDMQHRRIVAYINELHRIIASDDKARVIAVIASLVDYTVEHFEYEEELQQKAEYLAYETHKMGHDIFRHHITGYKERAEKGKDVAEPLLNFLRTWLMGHILRDDMAYVSAVKKVTEEGATVRAISRFRRLFGGQKDELATGTEG